MESQVLMELNKSYEFKKIADLDVDTPYNISKFEIVKTKFGDKVLVVLNDSIKVFLPTYYLHIVRKNKLDTWYSNIYSLVHKGDGKIEFLDKEIDN